MRLIIAASLALFSAATPLAPRPAARSVVVHGVVTDATSSATLEGAILDIVGTTYHAATTAAGQYNIPVQLRERDSSLTLRVRRIGYNAETRLVHISGDSVRADFALKQAVAMLSEVVTTSVATATARSEVAFSVSTLSAAGAPAPAPDPRRPLDRERYARITDNAFLSVAAEPLSTFSVDVDRASFANVRRFIEQQHRLPPKDAVRIEELINYFPYAYANPVGEHPIAVHSDVAVAPWNPSHRARAHRHSGEAHCRREDTAEQSRLPARRLGIDVAAEQAAARQTVDRPARRSSSRARPCRDRGLRRRGGTRTSADPRRPTRRPSSPRSIGSRPAARRQAAPACASPTTSRSRASSRTANNRVVLATDGDFNVGESDDGELMRLIEQQREEGVFLTVLGFGYGNLKDSTMEQLADKGNGNYAYIDDIVEARKMFGTELTSTIYTVAKDVKLQVEFNPAAVQAYRLIGYEDRMLANEDFANDKKDAGDMGAGHSVTAIYEIIPVGVKADVEIEGSAGKLRYQRVADVPRNARRDELMYVNIRYKNPNERKSRLLQQPVRNALTSTDGDFTFALAVAGYGMLLRDSQNRGTMTYDNVLSLARDGLTADDDGYRARFVDLVSHTRSLDLVRLGKGPQK